MSNPSIPAPDPKEKERFARAVFSFLLAVFAGGMFACLGIGDGKWWVGLVSIPVWWLIFYEVSANA